MSFPYSDIVLEHFRHPRNVGKIDDPDGKAIEGSPACGDMVVVYLKVDEDSRRIADIKFESYGCASNIATGSIITELAKGKTIDEARAITWEEAADALGGLPKVKTHCSVLAVEGLRAAIRDYEERHGIFREKMATTVDVVKTRLRHVVNPITGLDCVRSELLKEATVEDGVISVTIDLPQDHQFAASIEENIREKLETLWDIREVRIVFEG
jgi:NifU-like protein involved in Fe-S cluster formation